MASKVGSKLQGDQGLDPKYEWQENAANFVLRLHLAGFRKEDFRVQVDGAGRLTVRGQRADGGKHVRFHKVFQLPPSSNLDDISGRFDAGVLSLTVPKRPAPPPATIDDIRKPAKQADEAKPKEEKAPTPQAKPKEELISKKTEEKKEELTKKKPTKEEEEEDARKKAAAEEKKIKEEEMQAKINKAAADEQMKAEAKQRSKAEQEHKPKLQAAVDRDSILERVRRHAEEERAKAEEAAKRQKQQQSGWKERVAEELQGLRTSEWAEGMVETVKKNKEVIAAAVGAFSLGLFVSSRLCNRN